MDFNTLVPAIMIFFVIYNALGIALKSKRVPSVGRTRQKAASAGRTMKELSGTIAHLGFNQAILRSKGLRQRLDTLLTRAGMPFGWHAEDLLFYKEVSVVFILLLTYAYGANDPLIWIVATVLGFYLPDIVLNSYGSARKTSMERALPGFVDLLALIIESGIDLLMAIERIMEKMKSGPLREELGILLQESRLGTSRRAVLERFAIRTNLADAQSLTSLIIQSEQMGTPLASVLRSYAEDMRTRRVLKAEEVAGKIPVKILFPMIVFFFPIVFVIILAPVAVEFLNSPQ
jgi:tight adherence protein C